MFILKSQVNHMGLSSTLKIQITAFIALLIVIIINTNNLEAVESKKWLYLKKGVIDKKVNISNKATVRRNLRGSAPVNVSYDKMPDSSIINQIENTGVKVHVVSRWLDAVSVSGSDEAIARVMTLGYIEQVKPVASFTGRRYESSELTESMAKALSPSVYTALDYGPSYTQLQLCQIDSLHNLGFSGEGILIGLMDTGYNLEHPAISDIIDDGRLFGTYDFINNDSDVEDSLDAQQSHGTSVWSVIGGYDEGSLIGAAYNAEFFLAKTEMYYDEIEAEEDYWIAAAESMEVAGVDIISSSVGYYDWYDQSDMDGDTPAITQAADIAASLGVIVVNSAGNERYSPWGTIIAPADGDSVIAAGGVTSFGTLYSGSSPGPTADGRIKPDISAMAVNVVAANYFSGGYLTYTGTSFSAPIIAGGIALILEAYPAWDVGTVISNLHLYGTNSGNPDNDTGYGIARFYNMYSQQIANFAGEPIFVAPHPASDSVVFHFDPPITSNSEIIIYTVAGDRVMTIDIIPDPEGVNKKSWNAKNFSGDKIASGIYLAYLQGASDYGTIKFAFVK